MPLPGGVALSGARSVQFAISKSIAPQAAAGQCCCFASINLAIRFYTPPVGPTLFIATMTIPSCTRSMPYVLRLAAAFCCWLHVT
jgi:hypothetical protein